MEKTKERQNIEFETNYQLQEFDEMQNQYYNEDGTVRGRGIYLNCELIMERMLKLINQMKKEINFSRKEIL